MPFLVEVVSPERVLFSGEADMVVCRTVDGEIAFMAGHAPFIGALGVAKVRVIPPPGGTEQTIAVHGGFVEVHEGHVVILSDVAELPGQIDVARATEARTRAEAELARNDQDETALAARARAELRLEVAAA